MNNNKIVISPFKMRDLTPEKSRIIQETLFKNGYKWCSGDTDVSNTGRSILFFYKGRSSTPDLSHSDNIKSFINYTNLPELTFEEFERLYVKAEIVQDTLKVKNLVKGEIYYLKETQGDSYIFTDSDTFEYCKYIFINQDDFCIEGDFSTDCGIELLRVATQEEKDWLNACIKANKFIPKEEALKSKDEWWKTLKKGDVVRCIAEPTAFKSIGQKFVIVQDFGTGLYPTNIMFGKDLGSTNYSAFELVRRANEIASEKIPEYVECVRRDWCINVGRIYKVDKSKGFIYIGDKNPIYYLIDVSTNPYYQSYFKPSTKEAYDNQFSSNTEPLFNVNTQQLKDLFPKGNKRIQIYTEPIHVKELDPIVELKIRKINKIKI